MAPIWVLSCVGVSMGCLRGPDKTVDAIKVENPAPSAQTGDAVPSVPYAGQYVFQLSRFFEDGCSQSFESIRDQASFMLHIDSAGRVQLSLDWEHDSTLGPSVGNFMAGDRHYSHRRTRSRYTWDGQAVFDGLKLRVELLRSESHCQDLPTHGGGEGVTFDCEGVAEGRLVCEETTIDAEGPKRKGSRGRTLVIGCEASLGLGPYAPRTLNEGHLFFAASPGVEVQLTEGIWEKHPVIRPAPIE